MMDLQDSDFDDDEGHKLHPFNPPKKKLDWDRPAREGSSSSPEEMDCQGFVVSPDTGSDAQESTLDGCKKPVKSQQSVGSPLKEDEFSHSIVKKTTIASCSTETLLQKEEDSHNRKILEKWKTNLEVVEKNKKKFKGKVPVEKEATIGQKKDDLQLGLKNAQEYLGASKKESKGQVNTTEAKSGKRKESSNTGVIRGDVYGGPYHVIFFADRFELLKSRNPAVLRGLHEGVLLDEDLKISDGQYREDQEYIVLCSLGEGAFGTAYLLEDKTSGKKFVGKRVRLRQFAQSEPTLSSKLDHPGILGFLGLLLTDDWVIFLSSYLPGSRTLQRLIDQSVLGQGRALLITQQLLEALVYLHSRHVVHNDIKPDNIVVGEGDRAQLIDFGLSRRLSAPNEASEIDESQLYVMDVQSLGCTLAYMITGLPCSSHLLEINEFINGLLSYNMHPRVRRFTVQMVNGELTAAQALEIVNELCSTLAIEHDKQELMNVAIGRPQCAYPRTPRGPMNDYYPIPQRQNRPATNQPTPEMSLSELYIHGDVEPRRNEQIEAEAEEEDMYGSWVNPDSPKTFNKRASRERQPSSEVRNDTSSGSPRNVALQGNACNPPGLSVVVINFEGMEPVRIQLEPDMSSFFDLVIEIQNLPRYSELSTKPFTLLWQENDEAVKETDTFGSGEHRLVAVEAPDGGDWLWRM